MKSEKKLIGIGILASITASLCCIMPILTLIAGTSGVLSTLSWLEPFKPYLIGITFLTLSLVWYQKIKSHKEIDCGCAPKEKPKFIHSKIFLGMLTLFALSMLAFPYYSSVFHTQTNKVVIASNKADLKTIEFKISGMTCANCEKHVNQEVKKLSGIVNSKVSYKNGNAIINFDITKTNKTEIEQAIKTTGYKVTNKREHQ
jgi:mercuric ion transport protein